MHAEMAEVQRFGVPRNVCSTALQVTECLAAISAVADRRERVPELDAQSVLARSDSPSFLRHHPHGHADTLLRATALSTLTTTHTEMTGNKNYERVPLPPVRKIGDPAYIREQQVTLKMKQSFGVSGVSPHVLVP